MVVAYHKVKSNTCAKCGKFLDHTMSTPLARRNKQISVPNETTQTDWEAFHESCLG